MLNYEVNNNTFLQNVQVQWCKITCFTVYQGDAGLPVDHAESSCTQCDLKKKIKITSKYYPGYFL